MTIIYARDYNNKINTDAGHYNDGLVFMKILCCSNYLNIKDKNGYNIPYTLGTSDFHEKTQVLMCPKQSPITRNVKRYYALDNYIRKAISSSEFFIIIKYSVCKFNVKIARERFSCGVTARHSLALQQNVYAAFPMEDECPHEPNTRYTEKV